MTSQQWFEARARLNHDLLLNKVLNAMRPVQGATEPEPTALAFLRLFLAREPELRELIREGPVLLQPGSWLRRETALGADGKGLDALVEFLDLEFTRTSWLPERCAEAERVLDRAVSLVEPLVIRGRLSIADQAEVAGAVQHLSNLLARLPSNMPAVVGSMA
jgi:hypothetical protein